MGVSVQTISFLEALFDVRLLEILLPCIKKLIKPRACDPISGNNGDFYLEGFTVLRKVIGVFGAGKDHFLEVVVLGDLGLLLGLITVGRAFDYFYLVDAVDQFISLLDRRLMDGGHLGISESQFEYLLELILTILI